MSKKNPYKEDNPGICTVCGKIAFFDEFGNGTCPHCGWEMCKDEEAMGVEQGVSYPMLVPVWRAREQYQQGKPFKATFEDFVNGLYFYSEMSFRHKGIPYEVFFKNRRIIFCCEAFQQEYDTREEFTEKANIDGRLLKDIWDEVENPSYMSCCD